MHLTLDPIIAGLEAYYIMDGGTATVPSLNDQSGANTGSLGNETTSDPTYTVSTVNIGNDGSFASASQTQPVSNGASTVAFSTANLNIEFLEHSSTEDFTVTYQDFIPNTTAGANGLVIFNQPTWTVNKATSTSTQRMNLTFTLPLTPTGSDPTKFRLLWRPIASDGEWSIVAGKAETLAGSDITFVNQIAIGQFMIEQFSTQEISDVRGNMYTFDATDDYIDAGPASDLDGISDLTLEAWVKLTEASGNRPIVEIYGGGATYRLRVNTSGNLEMTIDDGTNTLTAASGTALPTAQWVHVAGVFDGGADIRLYVDGVQDGVNTGTTPAGLASTTPNMYIGANPATPGEEWGGAIDEVRIWNAARLVTEIRQRMHITLKGNEPNLLRYYQFNNDGAINTASGVVDASGNNQDARTVNMIADNYVASEVAVAGGVMDVQIVNTTGTGINFPNTGVTLNFGTAPSAPVAVYRLQTEPPTGVSGINVGYNVDNQYYVIRQFGGVTPTIDQTSFSGIGYVSSTDVNVSGAFELYKRPSNSFAASDWQLALNAGTSTDGVATASGPAAPVDFPVAYTGFSQFVILNASGNSTLPIELLSFEAQRVSNTHVDLAWSTATEINSSHFEVERMLEDEEAFATVAELTAAGNSTTPQNYSIQDENAYQGLSYYRLKSVDSDGSFTYSEVKAVSGERIGLQVGVFPNPADEVLKLRIAELPVRQVVGFTIFNNLGQVMYQGQRTMGSTDVVEIHEVADLSPGSYYIQLSWGTAARTLPFLKQ